jgi:hypothetical protein
MEFMGPFFWLSLGGGELGEHRLRAQVSSQQARELDLQPRDAMHLHIPAEHIRLFLTAIRMAEAMTRAAYPPASGPR